MPGTQRLESSHVSWPSCALFSGQAPAHSHTWKGHRVKGLRKRRRSQPQSKRQAQRASAAKGPQGAIQGPSGSKRELGLSKRAGAFNTTLPPTSIPGGPPQAPTHSRWEPLSVCAGQTDRRLCLLYKAWEMFPILSSLNVSFLPSQPKRQTPGR